ncbi:hypothetical protein [Sporolactobacillus laevolacticus]|uniref:Uncharacterized protein n=1 Tax=Sporolactobacillus laevolacticus DSM 442 TaxID=1395513 RepID=V6IXR9_9BACL|nr:hypothetical protein [Sporolactobacillus laevolacticus]EST12193.1 hypothetical protein P343_07705 [Sporolactobacillus laevolacticus DSM 442]
MSWYFEYLGKIGKVNADPKKVTDAINSVLKPIKEHTSNTEIQYDEEETLIKFPDLYYKSRHNWQPDKIY